MDSARETYKHLQDEESRFLFENRLLWSMTGDDGYIDRMLASLCDKKQLDEMVEMMRSVEDRCVIRGAGNEYWTLKRLYPDLAFACFVDDDPVKQALGKIDGHPVISSEEFYGKHSGYYVAVNSSACNREIIEELHSHDIRDGYILNLGGCYSKMLDDQYFERGIISPVGHEVFIDGGAYDGATSRRFAEWCGSGYDRIYAFEPDPRNIRRMRDALAKKPVERMEIVEKGLWDSETEVGFDASGTQGAGVDETAGSGRVWVTSIDRTVGNENVTFIKLDVEGAEYEALRGAEQTIRRFHPRMAVSIYHKPEDIFTLPELILSFSGEYRFYLRHYQMSRFETILYAVQGDGLMMEDNNERSGIKK